MECRSAVGDHLLFVFTDVRDELFGFNLLVAPAAPVFDLPALWEETNGVAVR